MIPKYLMKSPEMRSLLEYAMHNNIITEDECFKFYSSSPRIKNSLRYLIANNLLKQIDEKTYKFIPENERGGDLFQALKDDKKKNKTINNNSGYNEEI